MKCPLCGYTDDPACPANGGQDCNDTADNLGGPEPAYVEQMRELAKAYPAYDDKQGGGGKA